MECPEPEPLCLEKWLSAWPENAFQSTGQQLKPWVVLQHPTFWQGEAITHTKWFSTQLSTSLASEPSRNQEHSWPLHGLWRTETQSRVAMGGCSPSTPTGQESWIQEVCIFGSYVQFGWTFSFARLENLNALWSKETKWESECMYLVGRKVIFQKFSSKNLWRYYGTFLLLERDIKNEHFSIQSSSLLAGVLWCQRSQVKKTSRLHRCNYLFELKTQTSEKTVNRLTSKIFKLFWAFDQ